MSLAFRKSGIKDDDRLAVARFCACDCSKDKSLTVQAPTEEVDINRIMDKVARGLSIPMVSDQPFYGDVSEFGGLQDALIKVQEANDLFMQYPWNIREKFDNDPVKFIDFLYDEKNRDEAVKMGMIKASPVVPEQPVVPPGPAVPKSTQ